MPSLHAMRLLGRAGTLRVLPDARASLRPPPRSVPSRWVYLDGLKRQVPTAHSLVLCFMVGPLGLVSHMATAWLCRRRSGSGGAGTGATGPAAQPGAA